MEPNPPPDPLRRQIALLWTYAAFTYPFACIPFLYFYFLDQGITATQYGTLISIYYLTMVVVEVPTGLCADRYGRRLMMVLGPAILALAFWVIWRNTSFRAFCLGETILGVGHSVLSGPPSALLFQTLRKHGRAAEYQRQESRVHALRLMGTGTAFLLGGIVAWRFGIAPTIGLTAFLCTVAAVTALFVRDVPSEGRASGSMPLLRAAARDLRKPAVRWVVAYFVVLFCLLRFPFHTYQPFLEEAHERDPLLIGALFFALNILAAPCSRLGPYLTRRFGETLMFWAMPLSLAVSMAIMAGQLNWLGISLFFAHQVPFGLHWALIQSYVNHRIEDASRATVLSVLSFAGRLSFAVMFPLVMGLGDVSQSYRVVGIGGIALTVLCMVPGARYLRGDRHGT